MVLQVSDDRPERIVVAPVADAIAGVSSRSAEDADVCAVVDHKIVQVRQHHSPAGEQ